MNNEQELRAGAIAIRFASMLADRVGAEAMATIVARNATAAAGVCHSHDFCDANEVMAAAFRAYGLDADPGAVDDELWAAAWDKAARLLFVIHAAPQA